ncbi:GMC family oxidoreductase [Halioxenophilus sp. WMMB6]|uniref:GMC family oxidoreductase n=1 Tax=Halioxenophilus sp. WMMB6 TaxID=3073815 RepID=UPI00295E44BA|nr:GMC family oxidoreductase N-terminal domain-containing protein [Halioxenophilus sp. WMMB6]
MKNEYTYIVVGAGSAGCAAAYKLSENPDNSVLLIESGPEDKSQFIHMPRGIGLLLNPGSKYIWENEVLTGVQGYSERWVRGRTLGGSSSVNGMIYMRGAPMDYDGWQANGCDGWGWEQVGPKFVELESHDQGAGPWRGANGPQRITTHSTGDSLCEAILTAGQEMGIARVNDVNDLTAVREGGFGYQTTTRYEGERYSAAKAFLSLAKNRSNFDILTETDVVKVVFDQSRAVAVKIRNRDGERSIRASNEIVLSAGSFQTPKILQLSGIGPATLLNEFGIPVVSHLPGVGQNLREHRHVDLTLHVKSHSQNSSLGGIQAIWSLLKYKFSHSGPMSHAAHEIGGFAKSDPSLDHADLQFGLMSVSACESGKGGDIALDKFPGITFITYFTRPESQGEVRIQSADPEQSLYINVNHLSAEIDRQKFLAAHRWNRRLAAQPALKEWVVEEVRPGPAVESDEEILAKALSFSGTCYHSSGTARMGNDEMAVVDAQLRVRGVEGLRVADTSVMPTMVSGNTNGPAMMIGLRVADFILQ